MRRVCILFVVLFCVCVCLDIFAYFDYLRVRTYADTTCSAFRGQLSLMHLHSLTPSWFPFLLLSSIDITTASLAAGARPAQKHWR